MPKYIVLLADAAQGTVAMMVVCLILRKLVCKLVNEWIDFSVLQWSIKQTIPLHPGAIDLSTRDNSVVSLIPEEMKPIKPGNFLPLI